MSEDEQDRLRNRLRKAFQIGEHPLRLAGGETVDSDGVKLEALHFETSAGETVRGLLTRPDGSGPHPAILYIHAHGHRYDIGARELLDGRPALQGALGPILARMGFVTLAIDLPCFGSRAGVTEIAAAKAWLWRGKTLAGQMLGELASAREWLAARPDVDASRIGAFGISMGATFAYWLAAVDQSIACTAHECCYADFASLIDLGAHDRHGIYLTVPGLLDIASNGEIAGLIAPRPQFVGIGDLDPLTPPPAVDKALIQTRSAYEHCGASMQLVVHREAEIGHSESAAMRDAVLDFLRRTLR